VDTDYEFTYHPVERGVEFNPCQSDWEPSNEFGRERTHRVDLPFGEASIGKLTYEPISLYPI
jgi:hypothetical protein